jgi:hypothetical protein
MLIIQGLARHLWTNMDAVISLSRRKHGLDSRRARQLRLRMRQKCNVAEQTTEALA